MALSYLWMAVRALDSDKQRRLLEPQRWAIATLLFAATLLNYLDRQVLALVSPVLRHDLGLTATGYSYIVMAFLLGYTATQLFAGRVIDRIGPRLSLLIAMLWWSAAGIAAAMAHSVTQLGATLLLMGVGEAANWPASVKAIQECFPLQQRAVAVGYFNSGSAVGAVLAPLVVTNLVLRYSWRTAFIVCGVIGFLWVIPWLFLYPTRTNSTQDKPNEVMPPQRTPLAQLAGDVRMWGIVLARFFGDSIWFFYIFWLPDYLSQVRGFSLKIIGLTAWIPFFAAGLGNVAGGSISGVLIRKGIPAANARLQVMLVSAAIMAMGAGIWYCKSPAWAIALISFVVFAYSSWAANILTLHSDLFAADAVATTVGFSGAAAGLGGILTTLLLGRVIDHYSYEPVFVVLGLLPICAGTCALLTATRSNNLSSTRIATGPGR